MSASAMRLLVLADGTIFEGEAIGAEPRRASPPARSCFNTALTGYQEVISDPSYAGQIITFTYPHIGNYGVNRRRDDESRRAVLPGRRGARAGPAPSAAGGPTGDLDAYLRRHGIPGIAGIDTRRLTRHLRDHRGHARRRSAPRRRGRS